jgi:hypothetical protein
MKSHLAAVSLCLCLPCWAQSSSPAEVSRAQAPPSSQVPQRGGEPQVKRVVSEDESTRIEELRVRGITRRVVVQSKLPGAPAYEIGSASDGRDSTQDRRSEGRSLWQLFAF